MERISYSIISRGVMLINYSNNVVNLSLKITGELIFNPPTFYADLKSLERELPAGREDIRNKIIHYIEKDSVVRIDTKIIFD